METWQLAVLVRIVAVAVVLYAARKAMGRSTRTLTLFGQLALAAFWTTLIAHWNGQWDLSILTLMPIGVGLLNGLANYLMWNANAISTSRNGFFTAFDDVFAMMLTALVVPGALASLTVSVTFGIVLCIVSAVLLVWVNYRKKKAGSRGVIPMHFYAYAFGYAACWGLAIFAIGYFAVKEVGVWRFVSGWYLGAAFVALGILVLDWRGKIPRPANTERATPSTLFIEILVIGGANSISLVLQYIAFTSVSLLTLQPAFLVMDIIIPILLGVFFFKERQQFGAADMALYGSAAVGFSLVFLGH